MNVAATTKIRPVGRAQVAEVLAIVIQVERAPSRARVEPGYPFRYRQEGRGFGTNGRERRQDDRCGGESTALQSAEHRPEILLDMVEWRGGKHLGNHGHGDARHRLWRRNLRRAEAQHGGRSRADDAICQQARALLKRQHGSLGPRTELPVDASGGKAGFQQALLQASNVGARGTFLEHSHTVTRSRAAADAGIAQAVQTHPNLHLGIGSR